MWECSELSDCECSTNEFQATSSYMRYAREKHYHRQAMGSGDSFMMEKHWGRIISAYSGLNLTLTKDKLPALSGIAKKISTLRPGDEYVAGLWRETIVTDLHWNVWPTATGRRPCHWRSPSWSWAALDAQTRTPDYANYAKSNPQDYARCLDVCVTPAGPDPTGEVSSGYILLDAQVILAQLEKTPRSKGYLDRWSLRASDLTVDFRPDCQSDFDIGSLAIGDSLLCLRLGTAIYREDFCLVLKQQGIDGTTPVYERVGVVRHKTDELEKYWFTPESNNTRVKIV